MQLLWCELLFLWRDNQVKKKKKEKKAYAQMSFLVLMRFPLELKDQEGKGLSPKIILRDWVLYQI